MNRYLEKIGGKFHRRRINESTGHICHSLMIICTQCQITIKPPLQLVSYTPPAHRWNISNEIFMKFYEYQMNRLLSQHCRSLLFNNLEKNIPGMGTISGLHGSETLQIQLQHVPCRSGKRFVPLSSNIAVKSPPKMIDRLMRKSSENEKIHGGVLPSPLPLSFLYNDDCLSKKCVFFRMCLKFLFNPGFIE